MRAAAEMNIRTVAIYSKEDRLALHRFKADGSYLVSEGRSRWRPTSTSTTSYASPGRRRPMPSTRAMASADRRISRKP
ncbi:biotin carboxylase N-terminal domain-containing protein [Cupriavidus basilensis]